MKKLFLLLLTVMTLSLCASAQTRTVQGTVVDAENDEPLIGVSVTAGTGYGVATDADGQFSFKVPASATHIRVSYVGYKTQEVKVASGNITVRLHPESNLLNEVITVAYGKSTRAAFTGSAAVVSSAVIENSQATDPLNAIKGHVAGVQMSNGSGAPGGDSPTIRIRGITSLNAGKDPLIILNGTPFSGSLQTINTNDIESMTVLKDAASAALYGARGANGVILITTKSAKAGDAIVSLDIKLGANHRSQLEYNYITDPAMYYETYYKSLYNLALSGGRTPVGASAWANNNMFAGEYSLGYNVFTVPAAQTLIGLNGKLNPAATLGRKMEYNGSTYWVTPDSWLDAAYKTSLRQEYNLSIAKGSDNNQFYMSVGYLDNDGITPQSGFKRLTTSLRASTQAKSWLKASASARYTHYDVDSYGADEGTASVGNPFIATSNLAPIYPLFVRNADGSIRVDERGFNVYDFGAGNNAGLSRPTLSNANPLATALLDRADTTGDFFSGDISVDVKLPYNITFTTNNTVEVFGKRGTSYSNPYYGSSVANGGSLVKSSSRVVSYTLQQLLNWSEDFGDHSVSLLAAHEYYNTKSTSLSGSKTTLFYPGSTELNSYGNVVNTSSAASKYNNEGWIFRALYDYDNRYFGQVSYRRDASSRFHPKHRWGNFWSASAAWLISDESFMESIDWIDMLKIKASYGSQGNDNIGSYLYVDTYSLNPTPEGTLALKPEDMGNEEITWETNGNFNIGFEFAVLNNRLTGNFDGFIRNTSDMLYYFPLPPSMGWSGYYANIGDMSNKGVELELHGTPVKTRDFEWTIDLNMTWYKNRITRLPKERRVTTTTRGEAGYSSAEFFYTEGQSAYTFYMQKFAGVDKETGLSLWYYDKPILDKEGNPVLDENGKQTYEYNTTTTDYSKATQYLCGSALAPVYGGFGTNFRFKGFDLSVHFDYALGGQTYDSQYASLMSSPTTQNRGDNIHVDILNSWTPENPNSNIPRYQFGDDYSTSTSDRFLTSSSYLSLSNIVFGYSLPDKVCHKLFLKSARIYFNADNVWLWSKRQGLDPRQSISGASNAAMYSPIRTLSGGLSVTF